jgi:2'-5' RNA ligase
MRTFIAIPLSKEARALLGEMQKKLRSFGADVRWTATSSIHLTLKFLGEIEPAVLPHLVEQLRRNTASERPFSLRLHGLGAFPNLRNPRVIWYGLEGDLPMLESLHKRVEAICRDAGFVPEERPYHPHLTLGRVQGKTNLQPLLDYIKIANTHEYAFVARDFHVYQSTLRPQGAIYTVLDTIALKDDGLQ